MTNPRVRVLGLSSLVLALGLPALADSTGEGRPAYVGHRACHTSDARITESSGLAVSTDGSALWTHNDSGDTARFFALDPATCATTASYVLALPQQALPLAELNPTSIDWEDMARGTDAAGAPVLLFGDIGDNPEVRVNGVTVYEVPEPATRSADPQAEQHVGVSSVYQLVYPGGPEDAESLLALPDGRLAVVTKDRALDSPGDGSYSGQSKVYVTSGRPTPGPNVLTKVADIDVTALPGVDPQRRDTVAVTSADITRDGTRVVIRTYTVAFEYDVKDLDLGAAFGTEPRVVHLLPTKQGESIAYAPDGDSFWTSTEGSGLNGNDGYGAVDHYTRPAAE